MKYVATDEMLADILTKPLPKHRFERLTSGLGLRTVKISTVKNGSVVIVKLTAFIYSLILLLRQLFDGCFLTSIYSQTLGRIFI